MTRPRDPGAVGDLGPGRIVVVIPAHNEAHHIVEALESTAAQTRVPDEVMVVVDRCSDLTSGIAAAHGASIRLTILNSDYKAGALNQALANLIPRLSDNDAVLMMDADTTLSTNFISDAAWSLREPKAHPASIAAVGGIFLGHPVHGLLGHLQNNEYVRYAREINRRGARADVLTGTATLFSARALRAVDDARSRGRLPPSTGIYGVDALTEDNELTLGLKHLGYRCVSPKSCTVGTELMPTIGRLFDQRLRWQRGALQNLVQFGLTKVTAPYVARQVLTYASVAFVPFFCTTALYAWLSTGSIAWSWFWIYVTAFVIFERMWSVKRGGWRSILLAAFAVPEAIFDLFLHVVYIKGFTDAVTRTRGSWEKDDPDVPSPTRSWHYRWRRRAGLYLGTLAGVAGLALACAFIGIAWSMIAVFVLAGAGVAALRVTGVDPFRLVFGTGEPAITDRTVGVNERHGFGGADVPDVSDARPGGEGTHHWLSGEGAIRSTRSASSATSQRARQTTSAWLKQNRRATVRDFKDSWR